MNVVIGGRQNGKTAQLLLDDICNTWIKAGGTMNNMNENYFYYKWSTGVYEMPKTAENWPVLAIREYIITHAWTYDPRKSCYVTIGINESVSAPYKIKKVVENGPATIVFWEDGTKTIVKRNDAIENDASDIYAAVAQALAKKMYGSTTHFHKIVDKNAVYQLPFD